MEDRANALNHRKKEILERIKEVEELKRKIIEKTQELVSDYNSGKITPNQYKERLEKTFDKRTPQQWIDFYDEHLKIYKNYLIECEKRIKQKEINSLTRIIIVLGLIIGVIILLIAASFYLRQKEILFSPLVEANNQNLNLSLNETATYTWNLENYGQLIYAKLSGSFEGSGNVKIYLQDQQGNQWLIFDNQKLIQLSPDETIPQEESTTIPDENTIPPEEEPTAPQENIIPPEENPTISEENETLPEENTTTQIKNETPSNETIIIPGQNEPPTKPTEITIPFLEICEETCDLTEFNLTNTSYNLRIELNNLLLNLDTISYGVLKKTSSDKITKTEEKTKTGKNITAKIPKSLEKEKISTNISNWNIQDPNSIKVYWKEGQKDIEFTAQDLDNDGKIDTIEWLPPAIGENNFEIIVITKAEHLDSNKSFISDIYKEVKEFDDSWSETIPNTDYVRVTFEQPLTSSNDITLYPRIISGNPKIEVYEINSSEKIAEFINLTSNEYNTIYLTNLNNSQISFDLRIIEGEVEFDHIVDPYINATNGIWINQTGTSYRTVHSLNWTAETNSRYLVMIFGESRLDATNAETRIGIYSNGAEQFYIADRPAVATTEIMPFSAMQIYEGTGATVNYDIRISSSSASATTGVRNLKIIALRIDNFLNTHYNYTYNTAETTNVNNVWGDAMGDTEEITFSPPTPGYYMIWAGASVASGSTTSSASWRVNIDNGAEYLPYLQGGEATWSYARIEDRNTAERVNFNVLTTRYFSANPHSIKMQFADIDTTASADWRDRSLIILRLSDVFSNWYNATNITQTSTTSTIFQNKSILQQPSSNGNYVIIGSQAIRGDNVNYDFEQQLVLDGTSYGLRAWRPKDALDYPTEAFITNFSVNSGSHWNSMQYRRQDTFGIAYVKNSEILVLRLEEGNKPPIINVQSPTNTTYTQGDIWFNATANEAISSWIVNYNGTNITLSNINSTLNVELGFYHLLLYANNSINIFGLNDSIYFTVNAPQNQPPVITIDSIDTDDFVDLIQSSITPVQITFNVTDLNGYTDINDSSVLISFNYDAGGEPTRNIFTCLPPTNDGLNTKTYTCRVNMSYYDAPGLWTATVNASDFLGPATGQDTHQFNVNLLTAISLTPSGISFGTLFPGNTNIKSLFNTTITNEGNSNIPLNSKLQIISRALIGQTNPLETISGNNFKSGDQSIADICQDGINLAQDIAVDIPNILLPKGPSSTRDIQHCLTSVPTGISSQEYSSTGINAWEIRVVALAVLAIPAINRKKKKTKSKLLENEEFLDVLTNNLESLLEIIKERKTNSGINEIKIPLDIFKLELSPAEAMCKYLKENKGLRFNEIAAALKRNQRTIWINYRNSNKKHKEKIKIQDNTISVPIKIFSDRKLSVLESIVNYLKDKGLNNSQISEALNKSQNNIWTIYSRILNKLKNKQ